MEYCKKCGAKIDAGTGRCINCGLQVGDYSKKKSNIGLKIALVIIVLIVILLGAKVVLNKIEEKMDVAPDDGYMEVLEDIVDAVYVDGDMDAFVSLMADSVVESMIRQNFNGDEEAFKERLQEAYASMEDEKPNAKSVTWDIYEEVDVVGVQLNHFEQKLSAEVGEEVKIRAAKGIDMRISYKNKGEKIEDVVYVIVGIIDGEWCLIEYSE